MKAASFKGKIIPVDRKDRKGKTQLRSVVLLPDGRVAIVTYLSKAASRRLAKAIRS
jgi:hypothetical protein